MSHLSSGHDQAHEQTYCGRPGTLVVSATPREREMLRADLDAVVRVKTSSTERTLHIPLGDGAEPLCRFNGDSTIEGLRKDVASYPPGYCDWCDYCVAAWRRGERA
jgi:hypothetical protein